MIVRSLITASILALAASTASASINLSQFNLVASNNITGDNSDVQGRVLVGGMMSVNGFNFSSQVSNNSNQNPPAGIFNVIGSTVSGLTTNATNFILRLGQEDDFIQHDLRKLAEPDRRRDLRRGPARRRVGGLRLPVGTVNRLQEPSAGTNTVSYSSSLNTFSLNGTTNSSGEAVLQRRRELLRDGEFEHLVGDDQRRHAHLSSSSTLGAAGNPTIVINVTGIDGAPRRGQRRAILRPGQPERLGQHPVQFRRTDDPVEHHQPRGLDPGPAGHGCNTSPASLTGGVYVENVAATGEIDLAKGPGSAAPAFNGFVPSVSAVPEPATVLSTATGLALAGLLGRRRQRRPA